MSMLSPSVAGSVLLFVLLFSTHQCENPLLSHGTVVVEHDGSQHVIPGLHHGSSVIAWGTFNNTFLSEGFGRLSITTVSGEHFTDLQKAYAVGLLEGNLTHVLTMDQLELYPVDSSETNYLAQWLDKNIAYMKAQISANPTDRYWLSVELFLAMVTGLQHGLNIKTFLQIWKHVCQEDLYDIWNCLPEPKGPRPGFYDGDRCSGFIRLDGQTKDLLVAHTTWGPFAQIRILKYYNLKYSPAVGTMEMSLSSYPGVIGVSIDSFYVVQRHMAVLETTFNIFNDTLWKSVHPTGIVLTAVRAHICAMVGGSSAEAWANCFAKFNSGLYNNDWLAVDYNKWNKEKNTVDDGAVWCLEQIPGKVEKHDISATLNKDKYIASYNIPRFHDIYVEAGYLKEVKKGYNWWNFTTHPRAEIFRRNHSMIHTLKDIQRMIRYNEYKTDPLSHDNPGNGIAARFDLESTTKPPLNPWLKPTCAGGHDGKAVNAELVRSSQLTGVLGPTHSASCPIFHWGANATKPCRGPQPKLPQVYDFPWLLFTPVTVHGQQ